VSLYQLLGWPAFVGVAIMIVSIPLNGAVARILKRMQEQQMKNRDARTRLMSELLNNIRTIKLHAWENAFIRRILSVRNDQELKMLRKIGIATAFNNTLWAGIPLLVAFSSFAVAAVTSPKPLTSDMYADFYFILLGSPAHEFPSSQDLPCNFPVYASYFPVGHVPASDDVAYRELSLASPHLRVPSSRGASDRCACCDPEVLGTGRGCPSDKGRRVRLEHRGSEPNA
jgi:hypothetical protein